jgi:hypothetical protein
LLSFSWLTNVEIYFNIRELRNHKKEELEMVK